MEYGLQAQLEALLLEEPVLFHVNTLIRRFEEEPTPRGVEEKKSGRQRGQNALVVAAEKKRYEAVAPLLCCGWDPAVEDGAGRSFAWYARQDEALAKVWESV